MQGVWSFFHQGPKDSDFQAVGPRYNGIKRHCGATLRLNALCSIVGITIFVNVPNIIRLVLKFAAPGRYQVRHLNPKTLNPKALNPKPKERAFPTSAVQEDESAKLTARAKRPLRLQEGWLLPFVHIDAVFFVLRGCVCVCNSCCQGYPLTEQVE